MGTSKAWLPFGDEFMLQRVARILSEVVNPIVVVSAPDQKLPQLDSDIVICEDEFPDLGPLSGIHSGLKKMVELGTEFGFVTACDCPFLQPAWIRFLAEQMTTDFDLVLAKDEQFRYVLSALYRTSLHQVANDLLKQKSLRPIRISEISRTCLVEVDHAKSVDPELLSLLNLNTPEDYDKALLRLEQNNPLDEPN